MNMDNYLAENCLAFCSAKEQAVLHLPEGPVRIRNWQAKK